MRPALRPARRGVQAPAGLDRRHTELAKIAAKDVIVKRLSAVQALGAIDVLRTNKTGTRCAKALLIRRFGLG